jgi:hypothetical protein
METAETYREIERLTGLLAEACVCEAEGCRKFLGETASKLASVTGTPPHHPASFRFDEDETDHDPTGEWIDEDGDGWTLEGWLYPASGERPIPLMRLTREADADVHGEIGYLPDLINELGMTRKAEA